MPYIFQLSSEPIFPHDLIGVTDIVTILDYRSIFKSVNDADLSLRELSEAAVSTFASGAGLCKSCADLLAVDRTEDGVPLAIRFLDGYREAYLDAAFKSYAKELERLVQASTPQAFSDGSLYERIYALNQQHEDACGVYIYFQHELWPFSKFIRHADMSASYYLGNGLVYKY